MQIIELVIDEEKEGIGVEAVSVVNSPAIEVDFVALSKQQVMLKEIDAEKRLLLGPALIPNKQIYREDEENGKYYIWFGAKTIRTASELFFKFNHQSSATFEHARPIQGMTVVESWIIEDTEKDKSSLYNFSLPKGTWMMSMKVDNDEVWEQVKGGTIKGFSIEGYFADKLKMSKRPLTPKEEVTRILNEWKDAQRNN